MKQNRITILAGAPVFVGLTMLLSNGIAQQSPAEEDRVGGSELILGRHGQSEGFRSGVQDLSISGAAARGIDMFGSRQAHDLAWGSIGYGHLLWSPFGQAHWHGGQFEFRAELLAGGQFSPSSEWLIAGVPHLRYNFQTGTRWVPFLDAGAGFAGTSIGRPDLSSTFQFTEQIGPGLHCFLKDSVALTVEARFVHISNAGISRPNLGVNTFLGQFGLTYFF